MFNEYVLVNNQWDHIGIFTKQIWAWIPWFVLAKNAHLFSLILNTFFISMCYYLSILIPFLKQTNRFVFYQIFSLRNFLLKFYIAKDLHKHLIHLNALKTDNFPWFFCHWYCQVKCINYAPYNRQFDKCLCCHENPLIVRYSIKTVVSSMIFIAFKSHLFAGLIVFILSLHRILDTQRTIVLYK